MSPYYFRRSSRTTTAVVTRASKLLEAQRSGSHSAAKRNEKRKSVTKMSCRKKESVRQVLQDDLELQNMVKVTSKKVYRTRKVKKSKEPQQSAVVVLNFDENMNEVVLSHQESPVNIEPEAVKSLSDSISSKEDVGDKKVALDLTKASDDLDKDDIINALTLAVNLLKVHGAHGESAWRASESVADEWKADGVDQKKDVYDDDSRESRRDESVSLLQPDPLKSSATASQLDFTLNDDGCNSWMEMEVDDLELMQTFNPVLFDDLSSDDVEKVFEQDTVDGLSDFISDYPEDELPLKVFPTIEAARLYLVDAAPSELTETLNVVG